MKNTVLHGHFEASKHLSWWDGPDRHGNPNRNIASWIMRERDYFWIKSLFQGEEYKGLEIGGAGDSIHGGNCYGVEPIPGRVGFYHCDGRWLEDIENCSINYIVSCHVFEHLNEKPIKIFKRWFEVLKPGGIILIIMPDVKYFSHDPNVTAEYDAAPNEMTPKEMITILDKFKEESEYDFEILMLNTHQNNFDFDVVLRKK